MTAHERRLLAQIVATRERHFPRVSTRDRSRHLATCEYGYWRDGKRPVLCTKNCAADRLAFDEAEALLSEQAVVQLELVERAS